MAEDKFKGVSSGLDSPLRDGVAIVPNDVVDIAFVSRCLWVGTAGNLKVTMLGGADLVLAGLGVGWHPLRVSRVWATDTTAANVVAFW